MALPRCTVELFIDGCWRTAADVRCEDPALGHRSATHTDYDEAYLAHLDYQPRRDARAISCRYATTFLDYHDRAWPAFLLDLLPSGAARRFWERTLKLPNTESSDWAVLLAGAGNAPGNARIAEAVLPPVSSYSDGFERREVLERGEGFIEYAQARGASVAGASGAAGDAPKFLLREDERGRWHADGALGDAATRGVWLVKFPRSSHRNDRLVLQSEAPYMRIAKRLGARVAEPPTWEEDTLFVRRFDRVRLPDGRIERLGLESLCSLAGVTEFGAPIAKETLAAAIAKYTSHPEDELREFLLRDVLDVALGNTDNHARNTAVLKDPSGTIRLSPLYDFAPMVLDSQGIARVCRWQEEEDGYPIWSKVVDAITPLGIDGDATRRWLHALAPAIRRLPEWMSEEGVPPRVIDVLAKRIARTATTLQAVR